MFLPIVVLFAFVVVFSGVQYAQAEIFSIQGKNADMGIFIFIDGEDNIMKIYTENGNAEFFDSKVKLYKSGGFSIKNFGIGVWGHLISSSQYDLVILTSEEVQRITATTNEVNEVGNVEDKPQRIEPKSSIGTDMTYDLPEPTRYEPSKEIEILVRYSEVDMIFLNDEYVPTVKIVNGNYVSQTVKDVDLTLEISRDGNNVKTLVGESNNFGSWNPVVRMTYPTFYPGFCYDVKIIATWGNQTQIETDDFLVVTNQKYWEYGEEYSLGRDKIEADYKCND